MEENKNNAGNLNQINTPIQDMVRNSQRDRTVGPLIGSIIIIFVILGGGLYFWGSLIANQKDTIQNQEVSEAQLEKSEIESLTAQSTSDETASIKSDIEATDVDSLDADISALDKEY